MNIRKRCQCTIMREKTNMSKSFSPGLLDEQKGLRSVVSIIFPLAPWVEVVNVPCVPSSASPTSNPLSGPEVRVCSGGRPGEQSD